MTNSVTFPVDQGGDGNTYTDDADPNTGLDGLGYTVRFVPCLSNAVAMAAFAKQMADATAANRLQAAADAAKAVGARGAAETAADTATTAAAAAQDSAQQAAAIYPSVVDALGETSDGQYFQVPERGYMQLYLNDAGAAKPILRMASQESLDQLNERPDPLLMSLLF